MLHNFKTVAKSAVEQYKAHLVCFVYAWQNVYTNPVKLE